MVEHRPSKSMVAGSSPALRSISRQRMCRLMHSISGRIEMRGHYRRQLNGTLLCRGREIGMMSFEAAFLSHILLPSGMTVIEHCESQRLLSAPTGT